MEARKTRDVARDIYALTAKRKRDRLRDLLLELAASLNNAWEEPEEQEDPAEKLLERWMAWASGVEFASPENEQLAADTERYLAGYNPAVIRFPPCRFCGREDSHSHSFPVSPACLDVQHANGKPCKRPDCYLAPACACGHGAVYHRENRLGCVAQNEERNFCKCKAFSP